MKLWMSGEVEADIGHDEHIARNVIEPDINTLLENYNFNEKINKWAFLSIILSDNFLPSFPEVARLSSKGSVIEFRLHIPHTDFKQASPALQIEMILDALERSIGLMSKLKVTTETQSHLRSAVINARRKLLPSNT